MKTEKSLGSQAAKATLIEFLQKTTIHGFKVLYFIRNKKYQRVFVFICIAMGISFASYVVIMTVVSFLANPTVTSLKTFHSELEDESFPAVSICSNNKISRTNAYRFAEKLSLDHHIKPSSKDYVLSSLPLFVGLMRPDAVDFDAALEFQVFLEEAYPGEALEVDKIFEELSPSCEQLLLECSWGENHYDCSDLFHLIPTVSGYCCIFNYAHGNQKSRRHTFGSSKPMESSFGLKVVVNASTNDYFAKIRSTSGFLVQIFDHNNFPDPSTGSIEETSVEANTEVNIVLSMTKQIASNTIRKYDVQKRGCLFNNENLEPLHATYSRVDCLTHCKMKSIHTLCGCLPFYSPKEFRKLHDNSPVCTLKDVECMDRYKTTWNTYRPTEVNIPEFLLSQLEDALSCKKCYPLCSYKIFSPEKELMPLKQNEKNQSRVKDPISILRVTFPQPFATHYEKTEIYNWYQILSTIGGVLGICIGGSVISIIEVFYFFCYRFYGRLYKLKKTAPK